MLASANVTASDKNDNADRARELQMSCFMGLVSYLSSRPEVLRVSPLHRPETLNSVARAIVQSGTIDETPLSYKGLDGTGEVVQVPGSKRKSFCAKNIAAVPVSSRHTDNVPRQERIPGYIESAGAVCVIALFFYEKLQQQRKKH